MDRMERIRKAKKENHGELTDWRGKVWEDRDGGERTF